MKLIGSSTYKDEERQAAEELSERLGGLALAVVVMAMQIRHRRMQIHQFLDFYRNLP